MHSCSWEVDNVGLTIAANDAVTCTDDARLGLRPDGPLRPARSHLVSAFSAVAVRRCSRVRVIDPHYEHRSSWCVLGDTLRGGICFRAQAIFRRQYQATRDLPKTALQDLSSALSPKLKWNQTLVQWCVDLELSKHSNSETRHPNPLPKAPPVAGRPKRRRPSLRSLGADGRTFVVPWDACGPRSFASSQGYSPPMRTTIRRSTRSSTRRRAFFRSGKQLGV